MQHKLKQFKNHYKFTSSNRLPLLNSRKYLLNALRSTVSSDDLEYCKIAVAIFRWAVAKTFSTEKRISYRSGCFLTGRNRGVCRRFSISRIRIKQLSNEAKLFGAKKSSW